MVSRTLHRKTHRNQFDFWINWINAVVVVFALLFFVDRDAPASLFSISNRRPTFRYLVPSECSSACNSFAAPGPLPTFTNTPTNVTAIKGGKAILKCGIENLGTKTVIWRKQPYKVPIIVGKEQFLEIDRFQLLRVPHQDEWNLLIKNTQLFDSGTYECQVSLKGSLIRRNITLTVTDTPTEYLRPQISVTGTQFVEKGASIHLVCNVTSRDDPPQSVDWFKDGSPFQTSYSRDIYIQQSVSIASKTIVSAVDISKARMSDTGVYVCRATDQLAARIKVDVLNAETYNEKREAQSGSARLPPSNRGQVITHSCQITFLIILLNVLCSL